MSLTRYLPTPSDRMGILWTLLNIEDAIILEYGTAGTTAYAMKTFGMAGLDGMGKLFTTQMSEDDVVMGDVSRLEKKLMELDRTYHPKVIFVMASSVSSVTGSDVKGVCTYMQKDVGAQIITFQQGGFSGDFSSGLGAAYTELVTSLAIEACPVCDCYNLLGVSAMSPNGGGDGDAVEKMMAQFGLKPNAVLCLNTNLNKIITMSKAKVNLVLSYEGLSAAKLLKERFGTPYVYGLPIGYAGTLNWLTSVAKAVNQPLDEAVIRGLSDEGAPMASGKVALYGGYDILVALDGFVHELGGETVLALCTHNVSKIADRPQFVRYCTEEKAKIDCFKGLKSTLVLGDDCFTRHADGTNVVLDMAHCPSLLGKQGADWLVAQFST